MQLLEERILKDGRVIGKDILKVDSFLNHQIDMKLMAAMGIELKKAFGDKPINKILTVEASGIPIACVMGYLFECPVVFAKKTEARNLDAETYQGEVFSFTRNRSYIIRVSKRYLSEKDHVLIVDDFLANGNAVMGMKDIVNQAGAKLEGVGILVEKGFQEGSKLLREAGIKVVSLAVIESMENGKIRFSN
jgi:xanthine phosphoribosyltransferase